MIGERLLHDPFPRKPPAELLARLREIDPAAELVCTGLRRWTLGVVRRTRMRIEAGARIVAEQRRLTGDQSIDKLLYGYLATQGFSPIAVYEMREPDGSIVEDFRRADHIYRHRAEREYSRLEHIADGGADLVRRIRATREAAELGGEIWDHHVIRRPVSIVVPRPVFRRAS